MAYGRDAADVALISNYGPLETPSMTAWVEPVEVSGIDADTGAAPSGMAPTGGGTTANGNPNAGAPSR